MDSSVPFDPLSIPATTIPMHVAPTMMYGQQQFAAQDFAASEGSPYEGSDDGSQRRKMARHTRGACRRCKKLKMKCEYADESGPCTRCQANEHACEIEPRKHTTQKNARTVLLRQAQRKDALIASLLRHVYSTMGPAALEEHSHSSDSERDEPMNQGESSSAAVLHDVKRESSASPQQPQQQQPQQVPSIPPAAFKQACAQLELVRSGAVKPEEIEPLFTVFFTRINPQICLLDPALHAPRQLLLRCPFLFTTVCAVAAKHLQRPGAYSQAMACARKAAAEALISNRKTVEMCQAYILLGEFSLLAPTWEEDRSSLFRGLAIRLALDLDLGRSHLQQQQQPSSLLERRNAQRTWFVCAWLDWTAAMQSGRAISFPDDALLRASSTWYRDGLAADVHLCAHVELLRVVRRFEDLFSARDGDGVNFDAMLRVYDEAVLTALEEWRAKIARVRADNDLLFAFRTHVLTFLYHYCKLRMLSVVLERSLHSTELASEGCYLRCWHTGLAALTEVVEELAPTGFLQFAPDVTVKFAALSAAFTLKLFAPRFSAYVSPTTKHVAIGLAERLIAVLDVESPQGPLSAQMYAQALRGFIVQYGSDAPAIPASHGGTEHIVTDLNLMERQLFSVLDGSTSFA